MKPFYSVLCSCQPWPQRPTISLITRAMWPIHRKMPQDHYRGFCCLFSSHSCCSLRLWNKTCSKRLKYTNMLTGTWLNKPQGQFARKKDENCTTCWEGRQRQMIIGITCMLKEQLLTCWFIMDEDWWAEEKLNMSSSIIFMCLIRKRSKAVLAWESLLWRHIRSSATSWMWGGFESQTVWLKSSSLMIQRERWGQKIQSGEPDCFSECLDILSGPARDLWTRFHQLPSENKPGSVQRARLSARRRSMAALHQQVAYFSTLEFILCGRPSTFQKQGTVRV